MYSTLLRLITILHAKLLGRPLALCDISDLDGIACAALFKMRYPEGLVVLASPSDVQRGRLLRLVDWTFVADLPCPGKALIRADHHASNKPCAQHEFYDPAAPAAASLAVKALGLDHNPFARKVVELAVETDTARIVSAEALALNDAVKGSGYRGKLRLIDLLASRSLEEVLADAGVRASIERYRKVRKSTEELAERLPPNKFFIAVFKDDLKLSYRYLCILMERRGASVTALIVPKGLTSLRIYLGSASRDYDVSKVAAKFGGGGHPYAAGATVKSLRRGFAVRRILDELADFLGVEKLNYLLISKEGIEERLWP
ncbi:MAG: DHHA1 domain-containing protein [Thermofilaceae archaeon]